MAMSAKFVIIAGSRVVSCATARVKVSAGVSCLQPRPQHGNTSASRQTAMNLEILIVVSSPELIRE
jgi:hypothetical protein